MNNYRTQLAKIAALKQRIAAISDKAFDSPDWMSLLGKSRELHAEIDTISAGLESALRADINNAGGRLEVMTHKSALDKPGHGYPLEVEKQGANLVVNIYKIVDRTYAVSATIPATQLALIDDLADRFNATVMVMVTDHLGRGIWYSRRFMEGKWVKCSNPERARAEAMADTKRSDLPGIAKTREMAGVA